MSDTYNAADTRAIRAASKAAKALDAERRLVILNLMSSPAGRSYVYSQLEAAHIFQTSFLADPYTTAFREGERNMGLRLINDLMRYCPDHYISMIREANDKEQSNGGRTNGNNGESGERRSDDGWVDSRRIAGDAGGLSDDEYDPADGNDEDQS